MKRFSIQLNNPCNENRDEMTPTELGKFCMSCQKEVIDFTKMNDDEIISFFKLNKNKCGTFKASQLNRNLYPLSQTSVTQPAKYFFASLLSLNFLSASASIYSKSKIENDSVAIMVDSTTSKNDSVKLTKTDSLIVPNFSLNDSMFKSIIVPPYSFGHEIIMSGVPMILNNFIYDSNFFKNVFYSNTTIFVVDTINRLKLPSKIKIPFTSNYKEANEKSIILKNTKKKQKPIQQLFPLQAILTKRFFFNEKKKWFDWW